MEIKEAFLTISNYNRPGKKRWNTTAIACHYIGNPGTSAQANRNWFESLKDGKSTSASCHYIIGLDGEILQLIPEGEISWCTNSANAYTISIEACHPDATGKYTDATYASYVELCADICRRWGLDPEHGGLIRHYDVTGKICPKWFVEHPEAWEQFKKDVAVAMKTGWVKGEHGWWYRRPDGSYPANIWAIINHHWYLFNRDGIMCTGWHRWDGKVCDPDDGSGDWYFLDNTEGGSAEGACWHERADRKGALEVWHVPGEDTV